MNQLGRASEYFNVTLGYLPGEDVQKVPTVGRDVWWVNESEDIALTLKEVTEINRLLKMLEWLSTPLREIIVAEIKKAFQIDDATGTLKEK